MRALAAKLSDNPAAPESIGFCDGLAAKEDADAKGFGGALLSEVGLIEKGFAVCEVKDRGENNAVPMSTDC